MAVRDSELIAKANRHGLIRLLAIRTALKCTLPEAQERARRMVRDGVIAQVAGSINYCVAGYQMDLLECAA